MPKNERGDLMSPIAWVLLAVVLAIIEMFTVGLFSIWFALGSAIVAIVLAFLPTTSLSVQLIIFITTSLILLFGTRKKIKSKLDKNGSQPVYSILGKTAVVTKEINSVVGIGQINVNGELWSAKTENDELIIPVNSKVEVLDVAGVKAVVKLVETAENN